MKMNISFHECEHEGDLGNYEQACRDSGATVIASSLDDDAEMGTVTIEVADKAAFVEAFKKNPLCGFSSLRRL